MSVDNQSLVCTLLAFVSVLGVLKKRDLLTMPFLISKSFARMTMQSKYTTNYKNFKIQ